MCLKRRSKRYVMNHLCPSLFFQYQNIGLKTSYESADKKHKNCKNQTTSKKSIKASHLTSLQNHLVFFYQLGRLGKCRQNDLCSYAVTCFDQPPIPPFPSEVYTKCTLKKKFYPVILKPINMI